MIAKQDLLGLCAMCKSLTHLCCKGAEHVANITLANNIIILTLHLIMGNNPANNWHAQMTVYLQGHPIPLSVHQNRFSLFGLEHGVIAVATGI